MYIDVHLYDNLLGRQNTTSEFEVSCAGHAIITENNPSVNRPKGLPNYQILYIENGCGFFKFEDEYVKVKAKTAILFKPQEPQIYRYRKKDTTQTYWIHFSGAGIENFLDELELKDFKSAAIYNDASLKEYFLKTIYELQNKTTAFSYAANSFAKLALIELSREIKNQKKGSSDKVIENLCRKINMHYYENISNNEYAAECNMSTSYFLAKFKNVTGTSPQNYILNLRITNAKNLLLTTNYKITEISQLVGFKDSMHFCKRFKTIVGITPSQYRKNNQI